MKKLILNLLSIVLLFSVWHCAAQNEDLTQSTTFFQQQAQEYQHWLDQSGIGAVLRLQVIEPRPQELPLYLAFRYKNIDSIKVAWKTLKRQFDAANATTLEHALFYKLIFLMEVPDTLANIQIYNSYEPDGVILFFRGIYFDGKKVVVDSSGSRAAETSLSITLGELRPFFKGTTNSTNSKADEASFLLRLEELKPFFKGTTEQLKAQFSKRAVFYRIYQFAKQRYESKYQPYRKPRVEVRDSFDLLRFEVKDLSREVLTDADQPYWCNLLRRWKISDCNWVKREMLTFLVDYKESAPGIFRIGINIDGKVGSGYYEQIRDNGYRPMDEDFKTYLDNYAKKICLEVYHYLLSVKP
jgi:hypothetical protein